MSQPHESFADPPPAAPPHFSSGYFRDAAAGQHRPPLGRGMVGHVPMLAGLMVGLGVLEVCLAVVFAFFGVVSLALPPEAGLPNAGMLAALYGGMALLVGACGILRAAAGFYALRFQRRQLAMTALGMGLATTFAGICAPTAIGLAIYGLIVLLNESVVAAFEMGSRGRSPNEIQTAFPPAT